jgi:hypothetical protein
MWKLTASNSLVASSKLRLDERQSGSRKVTSEYGPSVDIVCILCRVRRRSNARLSSSSFGWSVLTVCSFKSGSQAQYNDQRIAANSKSRNFGRAPPHTVTTGVSWFLGLVQASMAQIGLRVPYRQGDGCSGPGVCSRTGMLVKDLQERWAKRLPELSHRG